MANQNVAIVGLAVATAAGLGAKVAALPDAFAGALAFAAFGVCYAANSLLKVDVPKPVPKAKKATKKEKLEAKAALAPAAEEEVEDKEDAAKAAKADAKALKKRDKERARKEAKKSAAVAEKQQEEQSKKEAEEKEEADKDLNKAKNKKEKEKEKKKQAKAKKAAKGDVQETPAKADKPTSTGAEVEIPEEIVQQVPASPSGWEEVKKSRGKKKVSETEIDGDEAEEHEVFLYVERKHFGTIIGPAGANLRAITEATECEIELPKEGGMRPEIVITGSQHGCAKAKEAIEQLVARGYCSLTHASTTEQSISIPDKKRGVVIGAKGINLRTIQDKCSVKINIPEKGSDTDDVTIVGDAKDVAEALAAITQLMEQGFSEITHANYVKVDMEVQRDMLKVLIGSGGATIKSLQTTHSVQIAVSPDRSGDSSTITVLGALEEVTAARQAIALLLVAPEPTPIDPLWSKEASASLVDTW